MQVQEKLSVKVHIAGRIFPLMVIPDEEEAVRQAAKEINDRLAELKTAFQGLDESHLLSMHCLDLATQLVLLKNKISGIEQKLIQTNELLGTELDKTIQATQQERS